jgi:2-polyprenyl-6-hydroxyphenyl methylase/3-demethylubiquinone-9 3-methyltransferase
LHQINPLRLDWMASRVPLAGAKVVDVGCGGGILAESMAKRGAEVLGIDLSVKPLKVARLHALETGVTSLTYREVAVEALAGEQPGAVDVVTCMEMLEHVPEPASVIAACATLVRPGGWVFFSTIHRQPKAFVHAILGAEYLLGLVPRGTHEYARFIRPSELAAGCRANGLHLQQTRGLGYNPLTRRYSLTHDTSVNYLLACRKAA